MGLISEFIEVGKGILQEAKTFRGNFAKFNQWFGGHVAVLSPADDVGVIENQSVEAVAALTGPDDLKDEDAITNHVGNGNGNGKPTTRRRGVKGNENGRRK